MENEKIVETVVELKTKVEQHDKDIVKLQDQNEAIYRLATSVELLVQQGSNTNTNIKKLDESLNEKIDNVDSKVGKLGSKVGEMDDTIKEIKNQPDKKDAIKWNSSMKIIGTAILSAVIGIILVKIGLI